MTTSLRDKKQLKRIAAVTGALLLHAGLFWALAFSSSSHLGDVKTTGDGVTLVEGVNMDLAGLQGGSTAAPAAPRQDPAEARMKTFSDMLEPTPTISKTSFSPANPARSITDALNENPFEPGGQSARSSDDGHVRVNDQDSKTMNDLWKAIEPCWNRVADKSTLGVTLEVSFSPLGNLSKPPVIHRDASAHVDDRTLRSESQAITALAQCGPYLMAFGQQNVEVHFPKHG